MMDDLSSGRMENLGAWEGNPHFSFYRLNLEESSTLERVRVGADLFIHLASNPEVRAAEGDPEGYIKLHSRMTWNALELCRRGDIPNFVLASSSTVYGDAEVFPTPEVYMPLNPISVYGNMKLASEQLLREACRKGGLRGLVLRFANIVGPRSHHGVIYDLARKLQVNPHRLEILGDGTQRKSYLHVSDCVDASLLGVRSHLTSAQRMHILNIGSSDWLLVSKIAEIVSESMGLKQVQFVYRPASSDGRGWRGDVKEMRLDISRLSRLGWKPKYSSEEAVRLAAEALVADLKTTPS